MKNTLSYKGYFGSVEYSEEDDVLFGRIIGISDRITYEGDSVKTLREDFILAVEDYLELCKELGKEPAKAYKGSFNVRIEPELHQRLAHYSSINDKSLNTIVGEAIRSYIC